MQVDGCEPNDVDVLVHLNLQSQLGVSEYYWVGTKVVGTSLVQSTKVAINAAGIVIGDPLQWLAILVSGEKRICSLFLRVHDPIDACL